MRESTVESYLHEEVVKARGTTRKWVSPGHAGVPDRIAIWPLVGKTYRGTPISIVHFIETKATDGKPKPHQKREHKRLRDLGCTVLVIDTKAKVDTYVEENR